MLRCAGNRVRLAASGGAVGKDGGIVAVENAVQQVPGCALVDIGLCRVVVEDAVEGKDLVFRLFGCWYNGSCELMDWTVFGGVKDAAIGVSTRSCIYERAEMTYRQRSSMTLITFRMPRW